MAARHHARLRVYVRSRGERHPARALDAYARQAGASLIVLDDNYGRDKAWSSSVARRLADHAACLVLVLSRHARPPSSVAETHANVVLATDYSEASLNAVPVGVSIARAYGSQLHVLHVLDGFPGRSVFSAGEAARVQGQFEAVVVRERQRLRQIVPPSSAWPGAVSHIVESGVPHRNIVNLAAATGALVIVLGVAPRTVLDVMVAGTTVPHVLTRATSPVMLVPAAFDARHARGWISGGTALSDDYVMSRAGERTGCDTEERARALPAS
jgi:nucleotide-binding universal stress UspA family protein